jgi:A/G-specific adenine glycosylase
MASSLPNLGRIRRALLDWHRREGLRAPWRETGDPYHALVAAVMAQQTQMSRVMLCYERFLAAFPTIELLAEATPGEVIRAWKGMGYNQRAVRLHRAAKTIAGHGWPRTAPELGRIDGIGPFTAAVVASFAFGERAACVDTNVVRVLTRLSGEGTLRGARLQRLADAVLPATEPARWNQAMMDYGARVCTPRPRCEECVVAHWCASREAFRAAAGADGELRRVAEPRALYTARPKAPRIPFEETPRYFRGRIVDALRELPPGERVTLRRLGSLIANGKGTPSPDDVAVWVEALEAAGLVAVTKGRIALPD